MGWSYEIEGRPLSEFIKDRTRDEETEFSKWTTLRHTLRGRLLWKVVEVTRKDTGHSERFIALDLIGGGPRSGWGYKDMDETGGPCYYSCPLSFLELAGPDKEGYSKEWRAKVREFHANKPRGLKAGVKVRLRGGCKPNLLTIVSAKPLRGVSDGSNMVFRIPRNLIAEVMA